MDDGPEAVTDGAERAAIRAQARAVLVKSLVATATVMAAWAVAVVIAT